MSTPFDRLFETIKTALALENSHGSDPVEVAITIVSLGCLIAKNSGVTGGAMSVLTSNLPAAETDEEKAIAAVRRVYAAARAADSSPLAVN